MADPVTIPFILSMAHINTMMSWYKKIGYHDAMDVSVAPQAAPNSYL